MQPLAVGVSPGYEISYLDDVALARDLDAMQSIGVTEIRLDFDWGVIERRRGSYDWSRPDRVVAAARRRGIRVHGLLTYTPDWARPGGTDDKHPPTDVSDYARFAAAAAQRYAPSGVRSWELWNEPNIASFWSAAGGPDTADYARLYAAGAEAIRRVDPAATLVVGGVAPAVDASGSSLSPESFLRAALVAIPPSLIDAVAVHPYSYPALPSDSGQRWNTFGRLPEIRDLVTRSIGDRPIWLTEFGAPTGASTRSVSEAQQAAMIDDALSCLDGKDWVGRIHLYNLRDRIGGEPTDAEDNFGLFRQDWSPKPAAEVVTAYTEQSAHFGGGGCADW